MTWIEGIATFFGLLCVWFTIKQNVWCWPTGLVQVFLYIFIFYNARLYADTVLQIIYVVLSIYGWLRWSKGTDQVSNVSLTDKLFIWIMVLFASTFVWGYLLTIFTDASLPYIDSFIVMSSLIAQWLMANKKLESWFFWITADIIGIGLYWYKHLYITSGLYLAFLIMAIAGYCAWQRDLQAQKKYSDIITV